MKILCQDPTPLAAHGKSLLMFSCGPILKENILVDENGMVYLIDFGFATLNSCKDAQQDERNQMLKCIECL